MSVAMKCAREIKIDLTQQWQVLATNPILKTSHMFQVSSIPLFGRSLLDIGA